MQIAPEVYELEALARAGGVPMSRALTRAGVSLSTWWRWKNEGREPVTRTVRKVKAAIAELTEAA